MNENTEQMAPTPEQLARECSEQIISRLQINPFPVGSVWLWIKDAIDKAIATERAAREKSDTFREELRAKHHQSVDEKNEWQAIAERERAAREAAVVDRDLWKASCEQANIFIRKVEQRAETAEYMGNLLAIVHCDGGQYHAQHGTRKATDDAIEIVSKLRQDKETAEVRLAEAIWYCGCGASNGVNLSECGRCCRKRSESEISTPPPLLAEVERLREESTEHDLIIQRLHDSYRPVETQLQIAREAMDKIVKEVRDGYLANEAIIARRLEAALAQITEKQ